jgi:hypothetical protein
MNQGEPMRLLEKWILRRAQDHRALKLVGAMVGLISLAALPMRPAHWPRAAVTTLDVKSMTKGPVTFTVWMGAPKRGERLIGDSVTRTTPATLLIDSTTTEIRILTRANAPVRVRVLADSVELQRPLNAWGRDLRLRRVEDHFQVEPNFNLIQPRKRG